MSRGFFFRFPKTRNVPIALVFDEGGLTKTTLRQCLIEYFLSESRAFWDTEGAILDSFMSTCMIIYMEKIKRQIMGSIYCVEIALTWAVPLHGF